MKEKEEQREQVHTVYILFLHELCLLQIVLNYIRDIVSSCCSSSYSSYLFLTNKEKKLFF